MDLILIGLICYKPLVDMMNVSYELQMPGQSIVLLVPAMLAIGMFIARGFLE